jgi:exopolysaccharide biosynthesis predicted pyruvyltransferase EpsI
MLEKVDPVAHIANRLPAGGRCFFMPNGGNLGDCLIASATLQAFQTARIPWDFIRGNRQSVRREDLLIFGGGGSLVPLYEGGVQCLESLQRLGAPVVVLPQTVRGNERFWSSARGITVFCRDSLSLEFLKGYPAVASFLADDMALGLDLRQDPFSTVAAIRAATSSAARDSRALLAYRRDAEARAPAGRLSLDISAVAHPAMLSIGSIHAHTCAFLAALSGYSEIQTDRLHVAIGGGLLGIPVLLSEDLYGKNKAVFETSLKQRFPHLLFQPASPSARSKQ